MLEFLADVARENQAVVWMWREQVKSVVVEFMRDVEVGDGVEFAHGPGLM